MKSSQISLIVSSRSQVTSVYAFKQLESDNPVGAAAVSVVLLGVSFVVLLAIRAAERWGTRHDR